MCLYFEALPLEVFIRPDNEGNHQQPQAVVVVEKSRVVRMNSRAARLGIKPGHSMDTAYSLSHEVVSCERNEDKEISTLSHLAQWAYQFTPNVAIKSNDCLLLDITGCLKLFKGIDVLVPRVEQGLRQLGYRPVITTGNTPLAAMLLARAHDRSEACSGATGLAECSTVERIGPISVRFLHTDEKTITSLQQMGISNIENLLALPISGLMRRFGVYFTDYLERLTGTKPDPQKFISPDANFLHDITFLSDVNNLASLTFPINRLLNELAEFLTARQLYIDHFTWHLSHRFHGRRSFSIYLANPENTPDVFLTLTRLKLDQINDVKEVDNIALAANSFYPIDEASAGNDLFDGNLFQGSNHYHQQNNLLLNMFRTRLGPGRCFGLSESNDHRPEKAWKTVPLNQKDYWSSAFSEKLPRPTFLLDTPRALKMTDSKPCLFGKLELLKGPERIDYGWWDQSPEKPLTRDYYIARQQDGSLYWIFQHVSMQRWYLHGIFS